MTLLARSTALVAIVLVALWLRTWDIARRPMHADEANQAVKTGTLIEHGTYRFDPADHHGPTLYFAAVPFAWLRGERTLAQLSETTLRLVPALFGTWCVLLLAGIGGHANRTTSPMGLGCQPLLAAAFLAVAPPAVYYARYFIQETLLVAFTLLAVHATQRWWITGRVVWSLVCGMAIGLMLATKETALLYVGAAAFAAASLRPQRPAMHRWNRHALLAFAAMIVSAGLLYSSLGRSPGALRDALVAPWLAWHRATGQTGHEKPWWYYLQLLTYVRSGGIVWQQAALVALALAGAVSAFVQRTWLRAVAIYTGVLLVAISAVPYKTPWNVLHVVPPLCLLAGAGVIAVWRAIPKTPLPAIAIAVFALGALAAQTRLVVFLRPADGRNPWAYVHSSADVKKYRAAAEAALAVSPNEPIRVISEEYWPLPWYLRGLPAVGYWTTPPQSCDGALVIASATQAAAVRERLHGRYEESFLGLRPGFVCVLFTRVP